MVFQGPVRPGRSVKKFRRTGKSKRLIQGPVRPGTDEQIFRETGNIVKRGSGGSGGSGGSSSNNNQAKIEAEARRMREEIAKRNRNLAIQKQKEQQQQQKLQNLRIEQLRINALRQKLIRENAQREINTVIDSKTKDKIKQELLINRRTGERIFKRTNLRTGLINTRRFQIPKRGGRARLTGGLITRGKKEQQTTNNLSKNLNDLVNNEKKKFILDNKNKFPIKNKNLTLFQKINLAGAGTKKRRENYLRDLKLQDLEKERDIIFIKLNKLNTKYQGELTELQFVKYQLELAPLVARYKIYRKVNTAIIKKLPKSETRGEIIYDPTINANALVLSRKDLSLGNKINDAINKTTIKITRGDGNAKTTTKLSSLIVAQIGVETIKGFTQLPSTIKSLVKNPSLIKKIPSALKESGRATGQLLRTSPTAGVIKIGAEIYFWTRLAKDTIKLVGKIKVQSSRLSSIFRGVKTDSLGVQTIKGVNKIGNIEIILSEGKTIKKISKKIKNIGKLTNKELLKRPALKGAYGFSKKQLNQYLGKSGPLTTAQADFLTKSFLKRNPILKNKKWLYATPWEINTKVAQVRVSRLSLLKEEGTLLDLLRGRAKLFNKNKPQIFVFPKEKIFSTSKILTKGKTIKTPKGFVVPQFSSELEVVLGEGFLLKRGKILATTIISGERIPIVELIKIKIPLNIVKEINNWKKLNSNLIKLMKDSRKGKLNSKIKLINKKIKFKENILNNKIKKLTNFDYFSSPLNKRRVFPIGKKTLSLISKTSRIKISRTPRVKRIKSPRGRISRTRTPRVKRIKSPRGRTPRGRTPISKSPISKSPRGRIPISKSPRGITPRGRTPISKPPIKFKISKKFPKRKLKKSQQGFFIKIKRRGKIVNLHQKPLTLNDAKDFLAYKVDHGLSRSAWFEPLGKKNKVVSLPPSIKGYFRKNKYKLRPFKIRVGKKKLIRQGYIEKTKYIQDTRGEKLSLLRARRNAKRKPLRRTTKKKIIVKRNIRRSPRRKLTPIQRRELLLRLKKARRIRMKNLGRR